jgi:hypothetical protein
MIHRSLVTDSAMAPLATTSTPDMVSDVHAVRVLNRSIAGHAGEGADGRATWGHGADPAMSPTLGPRYALSPDPVPNHSEPRHPTVL